MVAIISLIVLSWRSEEIFVRMHLHLIYWNKTSVQFFDPVFWSLKDLIHTKELNLSLLPSTNNIMYIINCFLWEKETVFKFCQVNEWKFADLACYLST